jgi:hypothetical protein
LLYGKPVLGCALNVFVEVVASQDQVLKGLHPILAPVIDAVTQFTKKTLPKIKIFGKIKFVNLKTEFK